MNAQIITAPNGERLVVIPEADYRALVDAAEDAADREAVRRFRAGVATGDEELVPAELANRILDGENRVRVWREYRGFSARDLAKRAGISPTYLSEIETGTKRGGVKVLKAVAEALGIGLDDLA